MRLLSVNEMDSNFPRIMGKPRFAGEALNQSPLVAGNSISEGPRLNNPDMQLIKSRSSVRSAQAPGGNFAQTRTEKFFERPG